MHDKGTATLAAQTGAAGQLFTMDRRRVRRQAGHYGGELGPVAFNLGIVLTLVLALVLRLWGLKHGLPFVYNLDEGAHFVPKAIGFFGTSYNPHYFINPPAFSYLLHGVFAIWFVGREGVSHAYAVNPAAVFEVARATAAVMGTVAVGLTAAVGLRLYDRRVGLIAAVLGAVAFLPVFYSHLALNDVPALVPLLVSLYGSAGILMRDRRRDWIYAGVGLGLACATKYTAGIVIIPLAAVWLVRFVEEPQDRMRLVVWGLTTLLVAMAAFVVANPYSVLSTTEFRADLTQQQTAAGEGAKLGQVQSSGHLYYLWSLTWGVGWLPALMALTGAAVAFRIDWRRAIVLVPYPVVFLFFMGTQERFFGRWLLPVIPVVTILAALALVVFIDRLNMRFGALRKLGFGLGIAALALQPAYHSVHVDRVLSRADTRNIAREWLVDNVPPGGKVVIEPVAPQAYIQDPGSPLTATPSGNRWIKYPTSKSTIRNDGTKISGGRVRKVNVEDYERTTRPALINDYQGSGYCTVLIGSTQYGRAKNEPDVVPQAIRYYRDLERRGKVVFRASPYKPGSGPVKFNFDLSFNYYPLDYLRPGPEITVYRLKGGQCGRSR